jgi:hypothetical protein
MKRKLVGLAAVLTTVVLSIGLLPSVAHAAEWNFGRTYYYARNCSETQSGPKPGIYWASCITQDPDEPNNVWAYALVHNTGSNFQYIQATGVFWHDGVATGTGSCGTDRFPPGVRASCWYHLKVIGCGFTYAQGQVRIGVGGAWSPLVFSRTKQIVC